MAEADRRSRRLPAGFRPQHRRTDRRTARQGRFPARWPSEAADGDLPRRCRSFSRATARRRRPRPCITSISADCWSIPWPWPALAEDVCRRYPGINRDLLVSGALLHDIGKVAELSYARTFDYTDEGKLIGHIVMGVEMIEEAIRQIPGFPRQLAIMLKHLLLSHHGQYEYGSPKRPKTLEAVILNYLDDLDSKINGVRTHIEKEPDSGSTWTSLSPPLRPLFLQRGDERGAAESAGGTARGNCRPPPSAAVRPRNREEKKNRRSEKARLRLHPRRSAAGQKPRSVQPGRQGE